VKLHGLRSISLNANQEALHLYTAAPVAAAADVTVLAVICCFANAVLPVAVCLCADAVAAVAAADPAAAIVVVAVFVVADTGDMLAAPAAVAYDVLAVPVCSCCIMCAVAVLAATYGILLLLCWLLQFAFAVCSDSIFLYALMLLSRTYLQKMQQNSNVWCSLAPLKPTSQHIRADTHNGKAR